MRYPYEDNELPDQVEDLPAIQNLFRAAHGHLWHKQTLLECWPNCVLSFEFWDGRRFECDMADGRSWFAKANETATNIPGDRPFVRVYTDTKLLCLLLRGDVHWNNAMNGMHVEFFRQPERYDPDLYMLLSYFHAPKSLN